MTLLIQSYMIEVGQVKRVAEDKYFNLSEKWKQRRTIMVGTTVAKDQT